MSMDLNQQQSATINTIRVASPQLVAANHILALSSAELVALINKEAAENPAIEVDENPVCQQCGRPLQGQICPNCLSATPANSAATTPDRDTFNDDTALWQYPTSGSSDDDDFDPTTRVPAQTSLQEHLMLSLQAQLPDDDADVVEYLVGNLDDDGRLRCSVEEVVELFDVDPGRVERAIRALQAMDPIGIGARDLRECLLIQLSYVEQQGTHQPFAREVISRFLPQLSEHKYGQIAASLGTSTDTVHQVSEFIKRNLNPFPARGFLGSNLSSGGEAASHVLPDVIIAKKILPGGEHTYDVEVVESKRFYLRLSQSYSQLYADVSSRHMSLSEDDRKHIQQYVSRAKLFIANINQRRQTLSRITKCLVDMQRDYLDHGIRSLHALTRAKVAIELGMHESTVSRATAAKYVMLPSGEVIPFSNFFVANLSIKDVIKDLIGREPAPLTDQELANTLRGLGIHVARRTVAKYREQLGILPSSLR
ncbi:MAG TPA: RNA polymerase factor sigma-54 [Ktedonobacterales bacterium]